VDASADQGAVRSGVNLERGQAWVHDCLSARGLGSLSVASGLVLQVEQEQQVEQESRDAPAWRLARQPQDA
jgi:hypothetical protein